MNQLITSNQPLTMRSFDLWVKLNEFRAEEGGNKIQHGDFLDRVEDECDDLGVSDFFPHPQNKQPVRFYNLNKDQMLLVGMRESKIVRKKVLMWIKEIAEPKVPTNFAEALQLAADQAKQLELAAPKVAFVDNLVERTNLLTATQVAQKHGKSAQWLNKVLTEMKVYNRAVKRCKVFQQWFVDKKYGEMKKNEMGYDQPLFTNAGEVWINEQLFSEGLL